MKMMWELVGYVFSEGGERTNVPNYFDSSLSTPRRQQVPILEATGLSARNKPNLDNAYARASSLGGG